MAKHIIFVSLILVLGQSLKVCLCVDSTTYCASGTDDVLVTLPDVLPQPIPLGMVTFRGILVSIVTATYNQGVSVLQTLTKLPPNILAGLPIDVNSLSAAFIKFYNQALLFEEILNKVQKSNSDTIESADLLTDNLLDDVNDYVSDVEKEVNAVVGNEKLSELEKVILKSVVKLINSFQNPETEIK